MAYLRHSLRWTRNDYLNVSIATSSPCFGSINVFTSFVTADGANRRRTLALLPSMRRPVGVKRVVA